MTAPINAFNVLPSHASSPEEVRAALALILENAQIRSGMEKPDLVEKLEDGASLADVIRQQNALAGAVNAILTRVE